MGDTPAQPERYDRHGDPVFARIPSPGRGASRCEECERTGVAWRWADTTTGETVDERDDNARLVVTACGACAGAGWYPAPTGPAAPQGASRLGLGPVRVLRGPRRLLLRERGRHRPGALVVDGLRRLLRARPGRGRHLAELGAVRRRQLPGRSGLAPARDRRRARPGRTAASGRGPDVRRAPHPSVARQPGCLHIQPPDRARSGRPSTPAAPPGGAKSNRPTREARSDRP
jgi:hypothetical protein